MRYTTLILFLFLLSAFAVGSSLNSHGVDIKNATISLEQANISENINLHPEYQNNSYIRGTIKIIEYYAKFITVSAIEVMKVGISFGYENPQYFEPSFILRLMKIIVWLIIISLIIKPLMYLIVLITLTVIWFFEKFKKKKEQK